MSHETIKITLTVTKELHAKIAKIAKDDDRSIQKTIVRWLTEKTAERERPA